MSEQPNGNGSTIKWRVEQLEGRQRVYEEGARRQADWGSRQNEQIRGLTKDVDELKDAVKDVPVLRTEVATLVDGWRAVRNAFLAAAGGLILLAASIIWQVSQ